MIVVMLPLIIAGCAMVSESDGDGGTYKDRAIQNVRSSLYNENTTYDKIVDAYLINPDWTAFNSDKDAPVVEVNGVSIEKEDICIQFIGELGLGFHLVEKQDFSLHYFEVDGQSVDAEAAMDYIFEHYINSSNTPVPDSNMDTDSDKVFENTSESTSGEDYNSKRELIATFTQVGLYDHDEYSYLDKEYIPTVFVYSDYTFEFVCNFYEYMHTYTGWWQLSEDAAQAEYRFVVENEPNLPNLDFRITHNKARCDADFYTDYDVDAPFGMTSIKNEEILFHPEYLQ